MTNGNSLLPDFEPKMKAGPILPAESRVVLALSRILPPIAVEVLKEVTELKTSDASFEETK